jgi:hypothetical protein
MFECSINEIEMIEQILDFTRRGFDFLRTPGNALHGPCQAGNG